jgi:hypothetical protein
MLVLLLLLLLLLLLIPALLPTAGGHFAVQPSCSRTKNTPHPAAAAAV